MEKCRLLRLILEYVEKKKYFFTYNEILHYIIYKDRNAWITTIARQIRELVRQGYLKKTVSIFGGVVFVPQKSAIRNYLRRNCH